MAFKLIVGLGNPGAKYEQTRHNVGFWFVEELAERYNLRFSVDLRSQGLVARLDWQGNAVYLLKPMQYMNRSGEAVLRLSSFYKISPSEILVAHDELDFSAGVVRLKRGGGHGGHNGLRDIVAKLGSSGFARIRLGIGHPGHKSDVVGYVLGRPSKSDNDLMREALVKVVGHVPQLLAGKMDSVMSSLH